MNYLKNKTCYLCGPIMALSDEKSSSWRDNISKYLSNYGINVLDPLKKDDAELGESSKDRQKFRDLISQERWEDHKKLFWPIARWDLKAVNKSDFIIFNYDADCPTVGTYHEIVVASQQKKPILLKYDRSQLARFNFWLPILIKSEHMFAEWGQMLNHLGEVDNGIHSTSYWV